MSTSSSHNRESTPALPKATHAFSSQYGYTEAQRDAALHDAEKLARVVDLSFFMRAVLPPVSPALVDRVIRKLKSGERPTILRNGHFRGFSTSPSITKGHENKVFRPLASVINRIIDEAASPQRQPRVRYRSNPDMVPQYKDRKVPITPRRLPNCHRALCCLVLHGLHGGIQEA